MKKHTEKPQIDDLFARKLANMSLPPSSDGFQRLQAKMGEQKSETKVVMLWRNPTAQRYVAAAACLALVCGLGWQYWLSSKETLSSDSNVAFNKETIQKRKDHFHDQSNGLNPSASDKAEKTLEIPEGVASSSKEKEGSQERFVQTQVTQGANRESLAANRSVRNVIETSGNELTSSNKAEKTKTSVQTTDVNTLTTPVTTVTEQVAEATKKPAERVLIVTIPEPEALVAARQAAKASALEEKSAVASADDEKEAKSTNIWQQVKRIKQSDVFARRDNSDEERGLLGRAYSGIKHNLDKDKPAKQ